MEPMTVSNFIFFADPELLDIAYEGRDILRILDTGFTYKTSVIAKMVNRSKKETKKMLKKLNEASLVLTVYGDFPDGKVRWTTLPTDEAVYLFQPYRLEKDKL